MRGAVGSANIGAWEGVASESVVAKRSPGNRTRYWKADTMAGGGRISARGLSTSRASKEHQKERKRRKKLGIPDKEPEKLSKKALWILVIAALVVGCVLAWVAVKGFVQG